MPADELVITPPTGPKWRLRRMKSKVHLQSTADSCARSLAALVAAADLLTDGLARFTPADADALRRGDASPTIVLAALRNFVDLVRHEPAKLATIEVPHWASLSELWGDQFRVGLGWVWYRLMIRGEGLTAVVSPNAAYFFEPGIPMRDMLRKRDRTNTIVLLYNMVAADAGTEGALLEVS